MELTVQKGICKIAIVGEFAHAKRRASEGGDAQIDAEAEQETPEWLYEQNYKFFKKRFEFVCHLEKFFVHCENLKILD
jgi:hypothetical protein